LNQELTYLIGITNVPNVGAVKAKSLIAYCGSATAVFQQKKGALLKIPGIGDQIASDILSAKVIFDAERQIKFAEKNNIEIISYLDENYPLRLKQIPDAPVTLYFRGNADLNHLRTVGIVGTRAASSYGQVMCERIVEDLGQFHVLVVSGLAFGIDILAHRKCIELGIPTVGVLGHGLDMIYPWQHRSNAEMMARNGGLLTEFPIETRPDKENFPMRNRLIAAMVDALIVVESAQTGGSMITAHLANGYNREVFAVPGKTTDEKSRGCNLLIKENKAAMIESGVEIANLMGWKSETAESSLRETSLFEELNEESLKVVDLLRREGELHIDYICRETGLTPGALATQLLNLEFGGIVKPLPGKKFMIIK